MITFKQKGNFKKLDSFFEHLLENVDLGILDKYGKQGVEALSRATPVDTGKTASSWSYQIERSKAGVKLNFINTNVNEYVNIAIILQYGHATRNGGYVQGIDYINPAIQPIFEELANKAWKELVDG